MNKIIFILSLTGVLLLSTNNVSTQVYGPPWYHPRVPVVAYIYPPVYCPPVVYYQPQVVYAPASCQPQYYHGGHGHHNHGYHQGHHHYSHNNQSYYNGQDAIIIREIIVTKVIKAIMVGIKVGNQIESYKKSRHTSLLFLYTTSRIRTYVSTLMMKYNPLHLFCIC